MDDELRDPPRRLEIGMRLSPPIAPMLAKLTRKLPEGRFVYEPKWDGFRALAFRDGDVDLRSRNNRHFTRYFPEVAEGLKSLTIERFVLDGELVVARDGRLDFASLAMRLHPAASRAARLAHEIPAVFIAFDVLAIDDEDLRARGFAARRARLEALLSTATSPHVMLTPTSNDAAVARDWLERFQGNGIDGVVAKDPDAPYEPGRRSMWKVKLQRTADCVVGGFRVYAGEPLVASLLLGLYDGEQLIHVGVVSQLTDAHRRELFDALRPLVVALEGHAWERGFGLERSPLGRFQGAAARWSPGMELDWAPIEPRLVCEVGFDILDGRRMRYPARFLRWRPDREAPSCNFDQLS